MEKKYIYAGVFIAFLIVAFGGLYTYKIYSGPRENTEYTIPSDTIEFTMYYATWCPHCNKAKPIWEVTTGEYGNSAKNGKKIVFNAINCSEPESENSKNALVNGKLIESFPSIFVNLNDGSKQVEFQARCTKDNLKKFFDEFTK